MHCNIAIKHGNYINYVVFKLINLNLKSYNIFILTMWKQCINKYTVFFANKFYYSREYR